MVIDVVRVAIGDCATILFLNAYVVLSTINVRLPRK